MRNAESWSPGKFAYRAGTLRASQAESVGSKLVTDLVATSYGEAIPRYVSGRLADLGCGGVPLYEACRPYVEEHICIDWAYSMHGNIHLDCIADLSRPLPIASNSFDSVILSDVLEHLPEPGTMVAECSRILRLHGKLLLNVPFFYWIHEHPFDYYRYTEFALRRFMEEFGFRILDIHPVGGLVEVVIDILGKGLAKIPILGALTSRSTQAVTYRFSRTSVGRRLIDSSATFYPLGYFLVAERL